MDLIFIPAALLIPIISIVWVTFLTQPGKPFSFIGKWLLHAPEWVRDPLIDCEMCNAGQISLWFFICCYGLNILIIPFICIVIYITFLLPKIETE